MSKIRKLRGCSAASPTSSRSRTTLVNLALNSSGDDNITVQFIRYCEPVPESARTTAKMPATQLPPSPTISERLRQVPRAPLAWAAAVVILLLHLPTVPPGPRINLQASSSMIKPGEATELKWEVRNATQVHIEPGIGEVLATGSRTADPDRVGFLCCHRSRNPSDRNGQGRHRG